MMNIIKDIIKKQPLLWAALLLILFSAVRYNIAFENAKQKDSKLHFIECEARGRITEIKYKQEKYYITLRNVIINTEPGVRFKSTGLLAVFKTPPEKNAIKHGMSIELKGKISSFKEKSNPGEFDYYQYNFNKKIQFQTHNPAIIKASKEYNILYHSLYRVKSAIKARIFGISGDKYDQTAAVISTVLLADSSDMDDNVLVLYRRNGIGHILSISGLHIWIIGMGIYKLLKHIFKQPVIYAGISGFILSLYLMTIGFAASSTRAYIMMLIMIIGILLKRSYHSLNAWSISVIISMIYNYRSVGDAGFILSYSAVLIIILVVPSFNEIVKNKYLIKSGLPMSIGLQIGMLPIILYFFYEQPLYAFIINLLAVPLMLPLLCLGILAIISAFIMQPIAELALFLSGIIIEVFNVLCNFFEKLPFSILSIGRPSIAAIILYYFTFAIMIISLKYFNKRKIAALSCGIALMLIIICYRDRSRLVITVLDVGQGECIAIELPSRLARERLILIDGGSTSIKDGAANIIDGFIKYKGYSHIYYHILTHSDKDHCMGIGSLMMKGCNVKNAVLPDIANKDTAYLEFEALLEHNSINQLYMGSGDVMKLGDVKLNFLHPPKDIEYISPNEYSTTVHLSYGDFDMLMNGDIEKEGERLLLEKKLPDVDVLKVAHHGSKNSSPEEMLNKLKPEYAVISCGRKNSYGHPHKELLDRLTQIAARIYRTDESGSITISTNGRTFTIKGFSGSCAGKS